MYLKKTDRRRTKPVLKFSIGDLARISFTKQPFQRAYQEQYTTEVFKVVGRLLKQGIPMYKLIDLKGERLIGLFYAVELQKVNKDENSLWFIESILKRRKRNKKLQYCVAWRGFPAAFNSWVDADEVKDISESET